MRVCAALWCPEDEPVTLRDAAGFPEQYIEQFKGCSGHRLRTMECLGLVDKDTIRNLSRDFHNSEAQTVVVFFCASSPSVFGYGTGPECALALLKLLTAVC